MQKIPKRQYKIHMLVNFASEFCLVTTSAFVGLPKMSI